LPGSIESFGDLIFLCKSERLFHLCYASVGSSLTKICRNFHIKLAAVQAKWCKVFWMCLIAALPWRRSSVSGCSLLL